MAHVLEIFTCPAKGQPMKGDKIANAIAGVGIEGDRYANKKGTYSFTTLATNKSSTTRHITLFSRKDLATANGNAGTQFEPIQLRRNVYVGGDVDILSWIGKIIRIGDVRIRILEECTPCKIPGTMARDDRFIKAFLGLGGVRGEILSGGMIIAGAQIFVE